MAESVDAILRHLEGRGLVTAPFRERLLDGAQLETALDDAYGLPRLRVDARAADGVFMLGSGALAPPGGSLGERDYRSVVGTGRLEGGPPLGVPVVLRVEKEHAEALVRFERVALFHDERPIGILDVEEAFAAPQAAEAYNVYGTEDLAQPGVAALHGAGTHAVAGPVTAFAQAPHAVGPYDMTPGQVGELKTARGWRTMVGFQTRYPVHRAHEYLQKVAIEMVDGLLLHPLIGETKSDDNPAATRMRAFWCRTCQNMASTRTCPHSPEERMALNGTRVRQLLAAGEPLPPELTRPEVAEVLRSADLEGAP